MIRMIRWGALALLIAIAVLGYFFFDFAGRPDFLLPNYPDDLDQFMASRQEALGVPGMSAAVVSGDGLVWEGYYGTYDGTQAVDAETLFLVSSISKVVVGTAIMQQWEAGHFDLDDDINDYLDFEVRHPAHPANPITFKDLMIHHSSIADRYPFLDEMYTLDDGGDSPWELGAYLSAYLTTNGEFYETENFIESRPGETYEYSNIGNALLAHLVENMTGIPFNEYAESQIFEPLGMENSYFLLQDIPESDMQKLAFPFADGEPLPHYNYPDYPSGSLRTTARDYGKFASFYLDPAGADVQILKPETVELMLSVHGNSTELSENATGLTWAHMDWLMFNAIGHNGGDYGSSTYILMYPEENHATIIFMNDYPSSILIYRSVIRRLRDQGRLLVNSST